VRARSWLPKSTPTQGHSQWYREAQSQYSQSCRSSDQSDLNVQNRPGGKTFHLLGGLVGEGHGAIVILRVHLFQGLGENKNHALMEGNELLKIHAGLLSKMGFH